MISYGIISTVTLKEGALLARTSATSDWGLLHRRTTTSNINTTLAWAL